MNRTMIAALGLAVAVTLGACVEDDVSFYIQQNNLPGKGCTPTTGGTVLAAGILDVDQRVGGIGYYMFPTVVNNMTTTNSLDKQPERNNLHMKRFDVSLDLGDAGVSVNPAALDFSVLLTGLIQAGGDATFGPIQVIDGNLAASLGAALCAKQSKTRPVVIISMTAVAERSSEERESAEFDYPVSLCCGCLVDWRTSVPDASDATVYDNECGTPQDSRVTCYSANNTTSCLQTPDS